MEDQGRRTFRKLVKPVGIIVVAALAAGAAVLGANYFGTPPKTDVDRVAEIGRNLPLVGLVLSEYPALDARYRAAIEEDLKNPVKGGLTASNKFGAEIRQQYVVPALRNADDASALSAVAGLHKLLLHLQTVNPTRCRDFGLAGLRTPVSWTPRAWRFSRERWPCRKMHIAQVRRHRHGQLFLIKKQ